MKTKERLITCLRIWIVIYPSITGLLYLFGDHLSGLPLYLQTFLLTVTLAPWMVFAGLPFLQKVVQRLTHKKNGK